MTLHGTTILNESLLKSTEATNERVRNFRTLTLIAFFVVGGWQIFYLRGYFQSKVRPLLKDPMLMHLHSLEIDLKISRHQDGCHLLKDIICQTKTQSFVKRNI